MKKYVIGISLSLVALAGLTIGMRADEDPVSSDLQSRT